MWLLVVASLLMSVASLVNSRRRHAEELNDLEKRVEQLENDFSTRSITTAGTHKLFAGVLTLEVFEAKGGLKYRVTRISGKGPVSAGPKEPFIENGSDWFAFAESSSIVWIFNGRDVLNLVEFFEEGDVITRTTDSVVVPVIVKRAPKAVRDSLPKSFLDKFKEK
jgi:hypothetical protein